MSLEHTGIGGGAIRIDADDIVLNGQLLANGLFASGYGWAGGSGGGVWITCSTFTPGAQAHIDAATEGMPTYNLSTGGGGGRVAIMTGRPTVEQLDALYRTGTCDNMSVLAANLNDEVNSPWPTLVNVAGGKNNFGTNASDPDHQLHGKPGTSVLLANRGDNVLVTISGTIESMPTTPASGRSMLTIGEHTFQADPVSFAPDSSELLRYHCAGYTWSNAVGQTGSGTTNEVVLAITEDTWILWDWDTPEYRLNIRSGGHGVVAEHPGTEEAWYAVDSAATLTAQADLGCRFLYWLGDVPITERLQTPLILTMDAPKEIIACFTSNDSAGRDLVWTGSQSTDWFDPTNWDGGSIPGVYDRVLIASNICTVQYPAEITVGTLMLAGTGTRLEVGATGVVGIEAASCRPLDPAETRPYALTVSGDLTLSNASQMVIGGWKGNSPIDLAVGGSLRLADRAALEICASYAEGPEELATYQIGGARVAVTGTTTLADSSVIIPVCHPISGAPVIFNLSDLNVATGASINANYRGFGRVASYSETGVLILTYYGPGKPLIPANFGSYSASSGGSYGGVGGAGEKGGVNAVGPSYGTASAPFYPGSPGDDTQILDDHTLWAGGAIRINANRVTLDGKLTAISQAGRSYACSGSGGGIWITCQKFILGGTGVQLNASASNAYSYESCSGGGGGRIAIAEGLSTSNINALYQTGVCAGTTTTLYQMTDLETFNGRYSVAGGRANTSRAGKDGAEGTAIYMVGPSAGTLILLR